MEPRTSHVHPQSSTLLIILLPNQHLVYASLYQRYNLRQRHRFWVKRTPKIQSQTKMKIITWYLWLFTVIHESREHLIKVDLHTGNVLRTFLKSVHIDQRIYDTIDFDRHFKWHYEYADLVRRRLSNPLASIYVWTFILRKLVECITNGGLPLVSSDTQYQYSKLPQTISILYKNVLPMVVFH